MTYDIIIEPEAFRDLVIIKTYITKQDTLAKADKFIAELKKSIKTLTQMPQRCRKSYYSNDSNTHDLIYKKYTTVFKIIDTRVHVLTIFRQREYQVM